MSKLAKLTSQTAIYGVSNIIGRLINYMLTPLYTAIFSNTAEMGVITELYSYVAFLNVIYTMGMETAYFRFVNKLGDEEKIYWQCFNIILIITGLFTAFFILGSYKIAAILNYQGHENYIQWLALIIALDAIVAIPFARLRLHNEAKKFAGIKLANIFINILMNIVLLFFVRRSVDNVFVANLIASMITLLLLANSFKNYKYQIDQTLFNDLFNYALPIMFMGLAGMVNEVIDRVMYKFLGPEETYAERMEQLGIYGACYKLSIFMSIAVQSFKYGADAFFFNESNDKDAPKTYAMVMHWFVIACLIILVSVTLNLDTISLILRNKVYREGIKVVPILLLANLFLGIYYNLSIWFKLSDKTYWGLVINLAGAAITLIGNFIFIPKFGYIAAAWVTLACYASMAIVSYYIGQNYLKVPYNALKLSIYITFSFVFSYTINAIVDSSYFFNFILKNALLGLFLWLLYSIELYKLKSLVKFKN